MYCVKIRHCSLLAAISAAIDTIKSSLLDLDSNCVAGACGSFKNKAGWLQSCFNRLSIFKIRPFFSKPVSVCNLNFVSSRKLSYKAACSVVKGQYSFCSSFCGRFSCKSGSLFVLRRRNGRIFARSFRLSASESSRSIGMMKLSVNLRKLPKYPL